ncbi:MAG TPA: class IV adenylate cyclase [Thermoanaerobaculia bacterium]
MTSAASPSGNRDEIELKLPSRDLDAVRRKLRERGGAAVSPLHFESNDLYDDSQSRLASSGCTLRLRRVNNGTILTFKGPARFESGVKRRREHETSITDGDAVEAILAGLGLTRQFRYEKRREEWKLEDCVIALDQTPIGDFVEIEGDPIQIRRVVSALELDSSEAIPYSYAKLYALRRQKDPALPSDMVFPAETS